MSYILHTIQELLPTLQGKDKDLAAYILAHPKPLTQMSITEVARQSGASPATITRFCKSLHFAGFPDLKVKLSSDLASRSVSNSYQDLVEGNTLPAIIQAIEANHIRSIMDTTQLIEPEQWELVIERLLEARRIDLYGVATSGLVAQDFYQKLVRIGKPAAAFTDTHMQITSASSLTEEDVAFVISYSGETPEMIDALRCAKDNGAYTISLTKYGSSPLSQLADIALFTSSLESGMRRGDMASRIAQLHVIDILFTGLTTKKFDAYVPRLEHAYQMVQRYRKDKGR
ncbi:MurR/RpiR family transcriptional regulator [Marinicrinis sediminis]|uniref:MurR/RpiR family transcriptional regulator n=1 Tax=Marinicrinis sediminis TaxID=1652465 RepID=A0ABW5RCE8_9BACL